MYLGLSGVTWPLAKPRFCEMWTLGVDARTSRIYIFTTGRVLSISFKYDITTINVQHLKNNFGSSAVTWLLEFLKYKFPLFHDKDVEHISIVWPISLTPRVDSPPSVDSKKAKKKSHLWFFSHNWFQQFENGSKFILAGN